MAHTSQFCTFYLDNLLFGVDLQEVQEVIRNLEMTQVPLAPAVVRGLINLRGQIVPAIDLRRLLNLPPREGEHVRFSIVARTQQGPVSLQVDEIGDVVDLGTAGFEAPPGNVAPAVRKLVRGVYRLQNRLLLVLDTSRATEIVPGSSASGKRSHDDAKIE